MKYYISTNFTALSKQKRKMMFIIIQILMDCAEFHTVWYAFSVINQECSKSTLRWNILKQC